MNIRPSEVSDVLLQQLKGIDNSAKYDEVGTVLQVSDGVVRIYGLLNAEADELLEFDNGLKAIVMNLEEDNVGAILLGSTEKIKEGMTVKRTGRIASIDVSEQMLGRVITPLGEPLDGKGEIGGEKFEIAEVHTSSCGSTSYVTVSSTAVNCRRVIDLAQIRDIKCADCTRGWYGAHFCQGVFVGVADALTEYIFFAESEHFLCFNC